MSVPLPQPAPADLEKGQFENQKAIEHGEGDRSSSRTSISSIREEGEEITRVHSEKSTNTKSFGHTLAKVITARSNASVIDPGPPPDRGVKAWTQALMGHFVVFNTWGMISAFGVFQSYYTQELGLEPSAVSWIGSVQMFSHLVIGMFSGRALDAGFFKWVLIPGVLCTSLGMFLTSISSLYWQLFLAQGVLFGFGCGLQFTPCVSVVYTYFSSNKSLACAVVASGAATGGLVYPTIARQLLPQLGFAWTTRIMGFVGLAVGTSYCSLLKPRIPPRKTGPLLELRAFKETPYTLYVLGVFFTSFGQLWAFYYISSFATDVLGASYSTSINLLMVLNGVGLVGRLIPSYFADLKFGGLNTIIPFVYASGLLMFCWAAVKTLTGLYVFAVIHGFICAGFQGLFPSTLGSLTKDMSKMGVRNGQGFSVIGFANLLGPPIAGALVQKAGGNYLTAQMWSGSMIMLGATILLMSRLKLTGFVLRAKV